MFVIRQLMQFIDLLHKETGEYQIAAGFVLGLFMGFTPMASLFWAVYVLILVMFRVHVGAALLSYGLFKILSFGLDPLFDKLGVILLSSEGLRGLYTTLFGVPIFPFTRFNNSIVMGSLAISIILSAPFFYFSAWGIRAYRREIVTRIQGTWIWKAWKASKLYQLYDKYQQFVP